MVEERVQKIQRLQAPIGLMGLAALAFALFATPRVLAEDTDAFARCKTITDDAARLRCFESAADAHGTPPAPPLPAASDWRLIRSHDPRGGPDAVAIMRTADMARSDLGFAGLMFRCGEKSLEVVIVTTEPYPPRARATVKILAGGQTVAFDATVVPPFSALLLPAEAAALADGPWQALTQLAIEIDHDQTTVHGTVQLTGLASALATLRASCPAR
jgi:hypothetical protein